LLAQHGGGDHAGNTAEVMGAVVLGQWVVIRG
jgi:hypothetical protein